VISCHIVSPNPKTKVASRHKLAQTTFFYILYVFVGPVQARPVLAASFLGT
jgi:hypothetical protein